MVPNYEETHLMHSDMARVS